jgi:hypothetical protein
MATVNAVVYDQFKREDGTFHVQIKVFHKDVRRFIETNHYVTARQLDANLKIKDKHILKSLEETLTDYRQTIGDLAPKLDFFTCDDLKAYLINKEKEVDFIAFCSQHIASLRKAKRNGTADNHRAVRNSLLDYFKKKSVAIVEINSGMLFAYEKWLKTDRTMTRINQFGNEVTTTEKGMQTGGIYSHMRDLRTLFNEARKIYNNEDIGVVKIKHYPFKVYKIGAPPKTKKRNIPAEQILKLKNCTVKTDSRAELARDLFLLSFYMCGMNAVDFYNLDSYDPESTRLEYNRSKTCGLRDDGAFISLKIVPEARPLLEKYIGKLQDRYSTYNGLDTALSKGMQQLRKITDIADITFYWARHTFATIARNKCQIDKDDIAEALNHVDGDHKTTDIYIEKDWSIVDKVQAAIMKFYRELNKTKPAKPQNVQIKEQSDPIEQRKTMRLVSA